MPGKTAKRKAEPRKVKAAGKQKQAKKGKTKSLHTLSLLGV